VPEHRVRPDAALPVVDNGSLVVRTEQDELPVELEKVAFVEAVDLAVSDVVAVADNAPETPLGWHHLRHGGRCYLRPRGPRSRPVQLRKAPRSHRRDPRRLPRAAVARHTRPGPCPRRARAGRPAGRRAPG